MSTNGICSVTVPDGMSPLEARALLGRGIGQTDEGDWFIHPDDVAALDAELVEKVAASIEPLVLGGKAVAQTHSAWCRDVARAAIAVIRDTSEAQS